MGKRIRQYKGYVLKQHTTRDNSNYPYGAYKDGELDWEADSIEELMQWIDA